MVRTEQMRLTFSRQRLGMLLNILQCTGQQLPNRSPPQMPIMLGNAALLDSCLQPWLCAGGGRGKIQQTMAPAQGSQVKVTCDVTKEYLGSKNRNMDWDDGVPGLWVELKRKVFYEHCQYVPGPEQVWDQSDPSSLSLFLLFICLWLPSPRWQPSH